MSRATVEIGSGPLRDASRSCVATHGSISFTGWRVHPFDLAKGTRVAGVALGVAALVFAADPAHAQALEPRSYANVPVGLNFALAAYGYTEGSVAVDPSLPISNGHLHTNETALGYVHALDAWGDAAKVDVVVPYIWLAGSALEAGQPKTRDVSGIGDSVFRASLDFYGAPALSAKEFADYQQDLIVGASLQVTAPWSQYDDTRLVNLGTNRWSFKPELGMSKVLGPWTLELAPAVTFYTVNHDFFNGHTLAQDPLYSVQGHVIRNFPKGIWIALDGTYYAGGRTTINGVRQDTWQSDTRAGLTVSLPIDRNNSLKFSGSTGASSLSGGDFTTVGVAWQYRWGAGF
jgi:hypothetical protein